VIRGTASLVAAVAAAALASTACSDDAPAEPRAHRAAPSDLDGGDDGAAEMATLAALGYADYSEPEDGADERVGVVHVDRAACAPGYTLYTSIPHGLAELIDLDGNVVRAWGSTGDQADQWERARLCANGDVLALGKAADAPPGRARFLARLAWSGEELWRREMPAHHDVVELEDGRILTLTDGERLVPAIHPTRPCREEGYAILSASGETLEERSFFDLHAATPEAPSLRPAPTKGIDPKLPLDVFHANSAVLIGECARTGTAPLYAPGNVLLSFRHQNAVAIVDPREGRFVWWWGPGELEVQHEAALLPSGNVLVLDNGERTRGWSRVVEVDPLSNEIAWQYRAPNPSDFFTASRGTSQALSNGNVLVASTNQGEAFEVTRDGRVVWRFVNPHGETAPKDGKVRRGALRIERVEPERVEPWLER